MRYCIFSDIHGNLEALLAVLSSLEGESGLNYICLGDVVGYGANPNECVELVKTTASFCLAGNHDHAVLGRMDTSNFNQYARTAIGWTRQALTTESREFLESLELSKESSDYTFVHATPCNPERWNYLFTLVDAQLNFGCFRTKVCFLGHSHQPLVLALSPGGRLEVGAASLVRLRENVRYMINVGSVGQPRDGDPRACFAILDTDKGEVEIRRVHYDVREAQRKMIEARLPDYLVDRLRHGR